MKWLCTIFVALNSVAYASDDSEKKREEAIDLFVDASKDFFIGSLEIAGAIVAAEATFFLALPAVEDGCERLIDAWDKIHECAENFREANRLNELDK